MVRFEPSYSVPPPPLTLDQLTALYNTCGGTIEVDSKGGFATINRTRGIPKREYRLNTDQQLWYLDD